MTEIRTIASRDKSNLVFPITFYDPKTNICKKMPLDYADEVIMKAFDDYCDAVVKSNNLKKEDWYNYW